MWGGPPSLNPCPPDPFPQFSRRQVRRRRSRLSFSTPEAPVMAASSSRPLPVEERLKQLDEKLENLKNMLQYQLDFLENLDSEAGRRMEQLEQDLSFVKIGFTEELDKLHQELKSPQERFEDRIGGLEDKLAKLNLEWGDSSEK
jgi:chromosome segregation ATPase